MSGSNSTLRKSNSHSSVCTLHKWHRWASARTFWTWPRCEGILFMQLFTSAVFILNALNTLQRGGSHTYWREKKSLWAWSDEEAARLSCVSPPAHLPTCLGAALMIFFTLWVTQQFTPPTLSVQQACLVVDLKHDKFMSPVVFLQMHTKCDCLLLLLLLLSL